MFELNLYMDVYIQDKTNKNFSGGDKNRWIQENNRRNKHYLYRHITKEKELFFSISSYANIPFANTILNLEFEKVTALTSRINKFSIKHFANLELNNGRSTHVKEFVLNLSKFNTNSFTWFTVNHDHPFISHPTRLNELLDTVQQDIFLEKCGYIIPFSHFQEMRQQIGFFSKNYMNILGVTFKLIAERDYYFILECNRLQLDTNFIAPTWFLKSILDRLDPCMRMRRLEDTDLYLAKEKLIVVLPKVELCRHFDSYNLSSQLVVPPLYMPDRFLTQDMKMQIGGKKRDSDIDIWVTRETNNFAFEDNDGADFPGNLADVPYFWGDYIDISKADFDNLYKQASLDQDISIYKQRSVDPFLNRSLLYYFFRNTIKLVLSMIKAILK